LNPATLQLVTTIVGALIIAAILGLARWITELKKSLSDKADNADVAKLEVKLEAALLVVGASITRPELAEKMLNSAGRNDDKMARVLADIVQLNIDTKANAKATAETDKKMDDLPNRVRQLEDNQKRN